MRLPNRQLNSQRGFTFIELLIAMALFAFVLVIISTTIVQLYRIYQSTVGIRNTQQAARLIAEELTRQSRGASSMQVVNGPGAYGQTATGGGAVSTRHDVVCFYTTEVATPGAPGAAPQQGTMFYTITTGQNQQEIWKQNLGPGDACQRPATAVGERLANADNVSFLRFQVDAVGSDLVNFRMTVASTSAIQPVDLGQSPVDAGNVSCAPSLTPQWCSITQIATSVALREVVR